MTAPRDGVRAATAGRRPHASRGALRRAALALALIVAVAPGPAPAQTQPPASSPESERALFEAVRANDFAAVEEIVAAGADVEAADRFGLTPIDVAVEKGYFKIAHFLLSIRNVRRDIRAEQEAASPPPSAPAPAATRPRLPPAPAAAEPAPAIRAGDARFDVGLPPAPPAATPPAADAPPSAVAGPPQQPPPPAPTQPRGVAAQAMPPPGAAPVAEADAGPAWPAGKPNPFDPNVAAPGAVLAVVGDVRAPEAPPPLPGQRPAPRPAAPAGPPAVASPPMPPAKAAAVAASPEPAAAPSPPAPVAAAPSPPAGDEPGVLGRMLRWVAGDDDAEPKPPTVAAAPPSPPAEAPPVEAPTAPAEPASRPVIRQTAPSVEMQRPEPGAAPEADADLAPDPAAPTEVAAAEPGEPPEDGDPEISEGPGIVGKVLSFIGIFEPRSGEKAPLAAASAESEETQADAPPAAAPAPAEVASVTAGPAVEPVRTRPPLDGVALALGGYALGKPKPPAPASPDSDVRCLEKRGGAMVFCVEGVDWPPEIKAQLRVSSVMYQGAKAVARYVDGRAVRYHAIFPSEAFPALAAHFERDFGPPTDELNREVRPFASSPLANPTLMWRSVGADGRLTVLEVRKFDDARGGFPDTKRGAAMLFAEDAPPIFPVLSSMDLMLMQWARGR